VTLTIPTADLVGCIADAMHFISPDKEDVERRCVHLRWDGHLFHASALDGIRCAVSSWSPDDQPDKDVQDALEVQLGGGDPFEFLLAADDAKHLLDTAKPIKNLEYVPLFLDHDDAALRVRRAKQTRVPGFALTYDSQPSGFPDVREFVVRAMGRVDDVKEVWFNAALLADFGKVRQRGHAAKFTFGGADSPTVIEIGDRFVGAIQPVRVGGDTTQQLGEEQ
jgi:hypothetical protein